MKIINVSQEDICDRYRQGQSSLKIGNEFNINKTTVLSILKKKNIPRRKNSDYRKIDYQKVINLYQDGHSISFISKELKCSPSHVVSILEKNNIRLLGRIGRRDIYPPQNKLNLPEGKIIKLYNSGMPTHKIAKRYCTSHLVICNRLKRNGIKLRNAMEVFREHNEKVRKIFPNDYVRIKQLYLDGYSSVEIGRLFNSNDSTILNVLRKLGVSIRRSYFGYNGGILTTKGIKVKSSGEKIIADWLDEKQIEYKYEGRLLNSRLLCDFYLPLFDFYIEYFGMDTIHYYKEKMIKKINFYEQNNLKLLPIYSKDNITKVLDNYLLNKQLIVSKL